MNVEEVVRSMQKNVPNCSIVYVAVITRAGLNSMVNQMKVDHQCLTVA